MKENVIILKDSALICENIVYSFSDFFQNIKLHKKRKIYILNENLYVKNYSYNKGFKINEKNIKKRIEEDFGKSEDYLFHYNVNKKKRIFNIYAIKGGVYVSKLCEGAKTVKIIPIQIKILDKLKRVIKDKSFACIFSFKENYYCILVEDNEIRQGVVDNKLENLIDNINNKLLVPIYKDKNIRNLKLEQIKDINLQGVLNEKIFS